MSSGDNTLTNISRQVVLKDRNGIPSGKSGRLRSYSSDKYENNLKGRSKSDGDVHKNASPTGKKFSDSMVSEEKFSPSRSAQHSSMWNNFDELDEKSFPALPPVYQKLNSDSEPSITENQQLKNIKSPPVKVEVLEENDFGIPKRTLLQKMFEFIKEHVMGGKINEALKNDEKWSRVEVELLKTLEDNKIQVYEIDKRDIENVIKDVLEGLSSITEACVKLLKSNEIRSYAKEITEEGLHSSIIHEAAERVLKGETVEKAVALVRAETHMRYLIKNKTDDEGIKSELKKEVSQLAQRAVDNEMSTEEVVFRFLLKEEDIEPDRKDLAKAVKGIIAGDTGYETFEDALEEFEKEDIEGKLLAHLEERKVSPEVLKGIVQAVQQGTSLEEAYNQLDLEYAKKEDSEDFGLGLLPSDETPSGDEVELSEEEHQEFLEDDADWQDVRAQPQENDLQGGIQNQINLAKNEVELDVSSEEIEKQKAILRDIQEKNQKPQSQN